MSIKKDIINRFNDHYYQFSFFILEDELQAMQLIVDVATGLGLKDRNIFLKLGQRDLDLDIYKAIVELGLKRSGIVFSDDRHLSLKDKAALFLSDNAGLSAEEISYITGIEKTDIYQIIPITRIEILERLKRKSETYA